MPTGSTSPDDLPIPRPRPSLIWIGVVAVLAAIAIWQWLPALTLIPPIAQIGGPFGLTDQAGHKVTDKELAGKPYAIFFGYTHCPDVCPTTLQDMTGWLTALGPDADRLKFVFVTVDPARDTQAAMAEYMKAFDPRIMALTGSESDVRSMLSSFRVYSKKVDVKGSDYAMDHTAAMYLMDGAGHLRTVIGYGEKSDAALARLKELINAG